MKLVEIFWDHDRFKINDNLPKSSEIFWVLQQILDLQRSNLLKNYFL